MAQYGFFCTQFLLEDRCDSASSCFFHHVNIKEVNLDEPIPNGSDFVKGYFLNCQGYPLRTKNRVNDIRSRYNYSRLPCCFNESGKRCSFGSNCMFSHSGIYWSKRGDDMDRYSNPTPSTSKQTYTSASTSNNNTTEVDDDSCLGATALIHNVNVSQTNTSSNWNKLESQNKKNLAPFNIDAPEFVPRIRFNPTVNSKKRLCPYAERDGLCKYPPGECTFLHGNMCDLCTKPALHPFNEDLRRKHTQECIKRHERDMEVAFAIARSKEKVCGICFEVIMQKGDEEQRFGILPSCNHCFCLTCIRRWRQSKQFENKIIRSCPECRITSDFVCPSAYWVDTKEDKDKLIEKYKSTLSKKDCKYFRQGRGHCPFGNKCFYRHCLSNGRKVDVGPPQANTNHGEVFIELPVGVEIMRRLIMMEHLQEQCPDDFSDDIDLEEFLQQMFNLNLSDILISELEDDY